MSNSDIDYIEEAAIVCPDCGRPLPTEETADDICPSPGRSTAARGRRRRVIDEFEGVLTATWFGDDIVIEIDGDDIDEYLVELKGQRVRVTVEVLP